MSIQYVQAPTFYLAGSGTIIGATNVTLTSLTDIYGNVLTMAAFGSKGFITLESDSVNEEGATFTSITANANGTYTLGGVSTVLAKNPYTESVGLIRNHSGGTKVVITDNVAFWNTFANKQNNETITGTWNFAVPPTSPTTNPLATTSVPGITQMSVAPADASHPIAVGVNDTTLFAPLASGKLTGELTWWPYKATPSTYFDANAQALSRTTYAALFGVYMPSQTVTITIATPGVFTTPSAHGYIAGDQVSFTTTGALPTGILTATVYYVISASLTSTTFQLSATLGGSAINTSGSQSGVHTVYFSNHGIGDGSTTFNVIDMRGFGPMGQLTSDTNFDTLGRPTVYVGEKTHQLITAELPAHIHPTVNHIATGGNICTGPGCDALSNSSGSSYSNINYSGSVGSDTAHNNMHPYKVGRWIIKS